jgi:hypothetical protein
MRLLALVSHSFGTTAWMIAPAAAIINCPDIRNANL